ncbi:hypothetical protein [Mesorhizobium sp. L-8-3]|uniref:hypothetical protein n=1 Tax=Mesorhizobium sp. L-8-3 TaxID=2744522 RepID=UPI001925EBF0|nr:hypothetical protein [Mesorhizobium sp. L-8-3]BCH26011.1 hypothetical protein MesoLjLb_57960 [Mesorhizobium sp. L-8-3]
MITLHIFPRLAIPALCAAGLFATQAAAVPALLPSAPEGLLHGVAADCYAIGQQVAAENGGTLAKASPATQGGQAVCRIVVLLPAKAGERPRRAEFVVPQN